MREIMFTMRFNEEEWARFTALAEKYGVNVASVIRIIGKEKADSFGLPKKRRK